MKITILLYGLVPLLHAKEGLQYGFDCLKYWPWDVEV